MDPESARIEHLKLVQAIIERMARNSFAIKAGASTLVAALIAVTFSSSRPEIAATGVVVLPMVWALDAYYLRQERLFRDLYDSVRVQPAPPAFGSTGYFSMRTSNPGGGLRQVWLVVKTMFFRFTMPLYYVPLLAFLCLAFYATMDNLTLGLPVNRGNVPGPVSSSRTVPPSYLTYDFAGPLAAGEPRLKIHSESGSKRVLHRRSGPSTEGRSPETLIANQERNYFQESNWIPASAGMTVSPLAVKFRVLRQDPSGDRDHRREMSNSPKGLNFNVPSKMKMSLRVLPWKDEAISRDCFVAPIPSGLLAIIHAGGHQHHQG